MSAFVLSTPCRLHSPPNPPRVAAQEAALSRKTTGSVINTVRSGPIVPSAPASASVPLWNGVRWRSVQTGLTTASHELVGARGFSCDPSWTQLRTAFCEFGRAQQLELTQQ